MVDYDAQGQGFKRLSRNKLKYLFMLSYGIYWRDGKPKTTMTL